MLELIIMLVLGCIQQKIQDFKLLIVRFGAILTMFCMKETKKGRMDVSYNVQNLFS